MIAADRRRAQPTPAQALGMTPELGQAVARMAGEAMADGHLGMAREILEGMVVVNPSDPVGWALLSALHRRQGNLEAARACAEVAAHLEPRDPLVRLARAESLLSCDLCRAQGRVELLGLAGESGPAGERARALLAALDAGA